jgi:hypothetical protein
MTKKIAEAACGFLIAGAAAAAWRFWQVDSYLAVLGVLTGLGMVGHAFGYKDW